ncbi:MAG: NUDIX hydrolase [bacterium]|nr:NUDIX hydrolase [Gammaproteobacteria bacterium]
MAEDKKHRNDIYGDLENNNQEAPAIPAATVVLLRDTADAGVEVLMLQKNQKISFGGMWVFPGGRIDAEDYTEDGELQTAALNAAVRETEEESGLQVESDGFVWFAHWTPPPGTPKRFATWFFAAAAQSAGAVSVDGQEILNHRWVKPAEALDHHSMGQIDLAPPTWITLYQLTRYGTTDAILSYFNDNPEKIYETRVAKDKDGERVAMWSGDAGYADWDADISGGRHRLVLAQGGFRFENTVENY